MKVNTPINQPTFGKKYHLPSENLKPKDLTFIEKTLSSLGENHIKIKPDLTGLKVIIITTGRHSKHSKLSHKVDNAITITEGKLRALKLHTERSKNLFMRFGAKRAIRKILTNK